MSRFKKWILKFIKKSKYKKNSLFQYKKKCYEFRLIYNSYFILFNSVYTFLGRLLFITSFK